MRKSLILLAFVMFALPIVALADSDPWEKAEKILEQIKDPEFPDRDFLITKNGGKPGPKHDNTKVINRLIEKCSKAGGGRVIVPAGDFYTGPITLKSNVNLHLEEGATLMFSNNPSDYPPFVRTRWEGLDVINFRPLIYANNETNIAVTGKGKLDGRADNDSWWWMKEKEEYGWKEGMSSQYQSGRPKLMEMAENNVPVEERIMTEDDLLRPQFISPINCTNVLIEGVTIVRAPFWVIHPIFCENVTVRDVTVSSHGPNNDGCNPESSKFVLIEGCEFDTGDDCIAIKSGRNNDGRNTPIPSENIIVRNCHMKDGHGGVVMGSEISAGVSNVFVENCTMDSPELDRVIRIKTNTVRGGYVRDIYVRNIEVGQCKEAVFRIELMYERRDGDGPHMPDIRNIVLENVNSQKSRYGVLIEGREEEIVVSDIQFINCNFHNVEIPTKITGSKNIAFENVSFTVDEVTTYK
ncbi:MAG: glycoside hydrolase family 28 protein [Bacteroidales bacterium]|nr:glycoside hydrolase family 28 protein [Bacteroidales bacterium]